MNLNLCPHCLESPCECSNFEKDRRQGAARTTHIKIDPWKTLDDIKAFKKSLPSYIRRGMRGWGCVDLRDSSTIVAVKGEVFLRDDEGNCWPINAEELSEQLGEAARIARRQRRNNG